MIYYFLPDTYFFPRKMAPIHVVGEFLKMSCEHVRIPRRTTSCASSMSLPFYIYNTVAEDDYRQFHVRHRYHVCFSKNDKRRGCRNFCVKSGLLYYSKDQSHTNCSWRQVPSHGNRDDQERIMQGCHSPIEDMYNFT